ncbi:HNH endonuclease [Gracilibacillus lacisalsi]|uniref:HNH endonuclease n=1 Tax=Gracilibacillus lacisalsi TaxID=393087 RepID=UPI00036B8B1C|nr:HNH endonuclease signature motif containing protein [Gracilibacillus lacisalsi]
MKVNPFLWTSTTSLTKAMRDAFYKSFIWQKKRETILERDEYLCQVCMEYDDPIPADTVHHIVHLRDDPTLALVDTNLISVCFDCHNDLHPEKGFGQKKEKKISRKIKTFEVNENPEQTW